MNDVNQAGTAQESNAVAVDPTKRSERFTFKGVKKTDDRFIGIKSAMDKSDTKYQVTDTGIHRDPVVYSLPIIELIDLATESPAFVADMIHKLVATTARKMFVDQYKPLGEIKLSDIVRENTAAGRSSVSTELLDAFLEFITAVMTEKAVAAGTIATVQALVKGKFNTQVLNKYGKMADAFPTILEKVVGYLQHAEPEDAEQFVPVCDLLTSNLVRYLEADATDDEELDFGAM